MPALPFEFHVLEIKPYCVVHLFFVSTAPCSCSCRLHSFPYAGLR